MSILPVFSLAFSIRLLFLLPLLCCVAELIHAPVANALAAEAAPAECPDVYLAAFQYGFAVAEIVVPAALAALFAWGTPFRGSLSPWSGRRQPPEHAR
jgi:hypothetical protein